jgi:hypothetical protein
MDIKDDAVYAIKDAFELTKIPERTLSRIAQKGEYKKKLFIVNKMDRRYVFKGFQLKEILKIIEKNKKPLANTFAKPSPLAKKNTPGAPINIADLQNLKLEDIMEHDFKFKREGEFPKEGNFVFVPKDFVYAEYTEFEYKDAEDKLKEWQYQKQLLLDQQKTFDNLIKTQKEQTLFYKNQVKYYQKLADRTLTMHEKLLETIQTQTKDHFIDTTIRAKKTDWSKKDKK